MRSKLIFVFLIVFTIAFLVGVFFLIFRFSDFVSEQISEDETENSEPAPEIPIEATETATYYPYNDKSHMDYSRNTDMIGWLTIPNSEIDFPVMQSYEDPDKYLTKDFFQNPSSYGCPYVQSNCDILTPSDNIIIYAHEMADGTMFAPLRQYKDFEFYKKHKTVNFEIDGEIQNYSVLAFIVLPYTTDDRSSFRFYEFVDAYDPKSFNDSVEKCKSLSEYDTEVTAEYSDKLLTLATSEYNSDNERLLLIAKQD